LTPISHGANRYQEIASYDTISTNWRYAMESTSIKEEAKKLIEQLPDGVTWDDVMHQIYVRQAIESGLSDSQAGRTIDVSQVRERFGLPQ
jgi:hypothetical protein